MACLRASCQAPEPAADGLLGEVTQAPGDELARRVEMLDPFGDDTHAYAVHVGLAVGRVVVVAGPIDVRVHDEGFVRARGRRNRLVITSGRHLRRYDRVVRTRRVDLDGVPIEMRVGEVVRRLPEIDQREEVLARVLVDPRATADDLLELSHRADLTVDRDDAASLDVDAGREQA